MTGTLKMVSIWGIVQNIYYGEVPDERLGYGWRRRTRRSGQQDSTSVLVYREEDGAQETFLLNHAVFDWKSEETPPELVSIYRVTEEGLARINNLEADITLISVPDSKGGFKRLLPRDPDRSVALAFYRDFLSKNREMFTVLEPGELRDEVVGYVLQWSGIPIPATARAHP